MWSIIVLILEGLGEILSPTAKRKASMLKMKVWAQIRESLAKELEEWGIHPFLLRDTPQEDMRPVEEEENE